MAEDRLSVEELCVRYKPYALAVARRRFGRSPEVESDALLGLLRAAQRFDPSKSNFRTYVARRVLGEVLDGLRSRDHLPRSMREKVDQDHYDNRVAPPISIDLLRQGSSFDIPMPRQADEPTEREMALAAALVWAHTAQLCSPREREALRLYVREGLTMTEIGERFGVTESRVSQIIKRAGQRVQKVLGSRDRVLAGLPD